MVDMREQGLGGGDIMTVPHDTRIDDSYADAVIDLMAGNEVWASVGRDDQLPTYIWKAMQRLMRHGYTISLQWQDDQRDGPSVIVSAIRRPGSGTLGVQAPRLSEMRDADVGSKRPEPGGDMSTANVLGRMPRACQNGG